MASPEPAGAEPAAITPALAGFLVGSQPADLPEAVRHEATRSLVNFMACAVGGCRDPAIDRLLAVLQIAGPQGGAGLIGRPEALDPAGAAFVNAAAGNVLDFDDAHPRTVIHPAAPVAAALFALLASRPPVSGPAFLHAFTLGVEVACRLGNAISPGHYARGFHITTTCGVLGAAAACAKLLDLDAQRTAAALGIAATGASGLVENLGYMAKCVGVGSAARDGLLAALFAQAGIDAAPRTLEGERGFLRVFCDAPRAAEVLDQLGVRWEAKANTYKPYPCALVLNPVIDALFELRAAPGFRPGRIARVRVRGHPLLLERADRPGVRTGREAKLSIQHTAAAVLLLGSAGIACYTDAAVNDPALVDFRSRVSVEADPHCPSSAARVALEDGEGGWQEVRVEAARGSLERPLSDTELSEKFRSLAAFGAAGLDPEPLLGALWQMKSLHDAGRLLRLSSPSGGVRPVAGAPL
jgi:2-methylcitrate dehydratase PrpD